MVPRCRWSWSGYFGIKSSASSPARSNRCERRPRPAVVCDADVLSGDCVLGQSVFRLRRAILGQVILCVGWAFCSCQSHLLYFMLSQMSLFAPFLIVLCLTLAFCSFLLSQSFRCFSLVFALTVVPTHQLWCGCWGCGSCRLGFRQCRSSRCRGCSCCRQRARRGTVVGCHWSARVGCGARHRCRRRWPGTSAVWHWGCPLLDRAGTPPPSWSRLPSAGRHSQSTAW